jgi:SAM-dependent methyltransferase
MRDKNSELKKYYEEWWENPEDPRGIIFRKLNRVVSERLPEGAGKRALDIGSGKGAIVSLLQQKGYHVSAVEMNENFTRDLRRKFPEADVREGDFNAIPIEGTFDLITAIEFIQNLDRDTLGYFFKKVSALTGRLIINISNKNSLHGFWTAFRGFQKSFVHTYTPSEIGKMLGDNGFQITFRKGIGAVTPLTLFTGFKCKIIPIWAARLLNPLGDAVLPRLCHLYYLEAVKNVSSVNPTFGRE